MNRWAVGDKCFAPFHHPVSDEIVEWRRAMIDEIHGVHDFAASVVYDCQPSVRVPVNISDLKPISAVDLLGGLA